MFTMMNAARLAIGVQGLATGERAYQQALSYARERLQGRAAATARGSSAPIIEHPDVRRMLLDLRSSTRAARLLLYHTAAQRDRARHAGDRTTREGAQRAFDLLTPIAKAWPTDIGFRLASVALQVHGGMGYVEETGIAQRLRDVRVASIYEGTNGIQAIDLVMRKVSRDGGRALGDLLDAIRVGDDERSLVGRHTDLGRILSDAEKGLRDATTTMVRFVQDRSEDALAGATPYLELAGTVVAGTLLARQALAEHDDELLADAEFFALERMLPAVALTDAIEAGSDRLGPVGPNVV
jgi:hypothetical protein